MLNWINAAAEWAAVRGADRLIAVSPSVREYMIGRGIPAERIIYVPNGVPARASRPSAARRPARGRSAPSRFSARAKASKFCSKRWPCCGRGTSNVRLRAVGGFETPAYKAEVLGLAERLDLAEAIDWIGFTRNVNRELAKIDLFVLPSLFGEGLPMVVLEAMAAGLPVVASRVEGVPEAVVHRETGLLVEPGSVSQLAQAIEEIVTGDVDYAALSRGARHRHAALLLRHEDGRRRRERLPRSARK